MTNNPGAPRAWDHLLVTAGDPPGGGIQLVHPPRRARVTAMTYGGEVMRLELDVVARAPGRVLVAQPRAGHDPWNAWIHASEVVPVER